LLKGLAIFMHIVIAMLPLGVGQVVNGFEDFGEEAIRAFGGALRGKVLGQVGPPLFGGDTFHEVLPANQILGMYESQKSS
jgi:hypothetical protein